MRLPVPSLSADRQARQTGALRRVRLVSPISFCAKAEPQPACRPIEGLHGLQTFGTGGREDARARIGIVSPLRQGYVGRGIGGPEFVRQFKGASLTGDRGLDRRFDAITGATISVNAMKNMARLALAKISTAGGGDDDQQMARHRERDTDRHPADNGNRPR
jgi:hypothetical protein